MSRCRPSSFSSKPESRRTAMCSDDFAERAPRRAFSSACACWVCRCLPNYSKKRYWFNKPRPAPPGLPAALLLRKVHDLKEWPDFQVVEAFAAGVVLGRLARETRQGGDAGVGALR